MEQGKRTKSFSARFSVEVLDKLTEHGRRAGQSSALIAERLIDEGLQMEDFPGVVFRTGPTGRRAGVAGGPDVWELVRSQGRRARGRGGSDRGGQPIDRDRPQPSRARRGYSAAYPDAVDDRIRFSDEAAERLRRALDAAALA